MAAGFSMLLSKLAALVTWFADLFVSIFKAAWYLVTDAFCWGFDKSLEVSVDAVKTIDVSGVSSNVNAYGAIPAGMLQVMACIGLGQALAIIASALAIRFGLQLIPFVRLGS